VTGISWASWLWRPVGTLRDIGWGDIVFAVFLSGIAVYIVSGVQPAAQPSNLHGSALAAIAALAMTVPVAWERRAPLTAAAVVAVGTAGNELLIGPLVRCGPGLPAVLAIAFFSGTRLDTRRLGIATALCAGSMVTQAFYDPQLGGPGFLVPALPALAAAVVTGRLVRSRGRAAAALRLRNEELREQREQTTRLAVAADRVRIAADLSQFLRDQLATMAAASAEGRDLIDTDPDGAKYALAAIEVSGRQTLSQMREVVGNLRAQEHGPQPVLAELGALLETATTADARLRVTGSPRQLSAGLELSAYRIVEHLLEALQDAPTARIEVQVRFSPDALELDVAGPSRAHADPLAAFATARERAILLGGTLHIESAAGRCTALVRLPLVSGYATA
jgi:signal transduction histidine kinase